MRSTVIAPMSDAGDPHRGILAEEPTQTETRWSVAGPAGLIAPVVALLPVLKQVLIAQVPVLPQLQGGQQHHESAKT
jgi:hypothetical protein